MNLEPKSSEKVYHWFGGFSSVIKPNMSRDYDEGDFKILLSFFFIKFRWKNS